MSCDRAFEIDLEDLLADPGSEAYRAFERHCAGCPDCADELALQRGLLARLKDEDARRTEHPADALLLRLARQPERLPDAELAGLRAHLRDCPPCRDAYRATLMLVPEPALSLSERAAQTLRRWLTPAGVPAWVPAAAAIVLVIGLTLRLGPLGPDAPEPELLLRGAPVAAAVEVEVSPNARASLSLYGLSDDDVVRVRVPLPAELRDAELRAQIVADDGTAIFEGPVSRHPDDAAAGFIEPRAGDFERESYRVELVPRSGARPVYWLDVR